MELVRDIVFRNAGIHVCKHVQITAHGNVLLIAEVDVSRSAQMDVLDVHHVLEVVKDLLIVEDVLDVELKQDVLLTVCMIAIRTV
jgi:hypothetical protein